MADRSAFRLAAAALAFLASSVLAARSTALEEKASAPAPATVSNPGR